MKAKKKQKQHNSNKTWMQVTSFYYHVRASLRSALADEVIQYSAGTMCP